MREYRRKTHTRSLSLSPSVQPPPASGAAAPQQAREDGNERVAELEEELGLQVAAVAPPLAHTHRGAAEQRPLVDEVGERVRAGGAHDGDDDVVVAHRARGEAGRVARLCGEELEVARPGEAAHRPEEQRGGELRLPRGGEGAEREGVCEKRRNAKVLGLARALEQAGDRHRSEQASEREGEVEGGGEPLGVPRTEELLELVDLRLEVKVGDQVVNRHVEHQQAIARREQHRAHPDLAAATSTALLRKRAASSSRFHRALSGEATSLLVS
eukprot:CAMPEP_0202792150 /NCGR_PEP_ID=MMETSP1388-20130828/83103_1 /ASSEMBLY_ACC=CAM_ASM_000864 /TAXON_ID=37098 /ORGANISM="Isochrysis sp, Strain CCMP1244" /LENGTH=269 /DNA_ID=CAMNT_0049461933 /DNA_START=52 /DNA_END=860 /DNA_ORIENTATION=+